MSKLRYKEGGVWKSIAPSQKEFDDNKAEVTAKLADKAKESDLQITNQNVSGLEASKATISYVDTKTQGVSLAYKESYATLTDLQTAYPTGNIYNHSVLADGLIYTYTTSWVSTGIQANGSGIADDTVTFPKLTDSAKTSIRSLEMLRIRKGSSDDILLKPSGNKSITAYATEIGDVYFNSLQSLKSLPAGSISESGDITIQPEGFFFYRFNCVEDLAVGKKISFFVEKTLASTNTKIEYRFIDATLVTLGVITAIPLLAEDVYGIEGLTVPVNASLFEIRLDNRGSVGDTIFNAPIVTPSAYVSPQDTRVTALNSEISVIKSDLEIVKTLNDASLPIPILTPVEFTWKEHPLKGRLFTDGNENYYTDFDVAEMKNVGGTDYYVAPNGLSTNDGLTVDTPLATPVQAIGKLDVGTIWVKGGNYYRNSQGLPPLGAININVNIVGYDGIVKVIHADASSYTKTAGYTNVYQVNRSSVGRVVDLSVIDGEDYAELLNVASIALVDSTPNSYFTASGIVYVHTINSRVADVNVCPVLTTASTTINATPTNVYFENIEFIGGARPLQLISETGNLFAKNCKFLYGVQSNGNGLEIIGGGLVISQGCVASKNPMDGFNYHKSAGTLLPYFLEIDCVGRNNGILAGTGGTRSDNGSTAHDGVKGIRTNGKYYRNDGGNVADVNAGTETWNIGCVAFESLQGSDFLVTNTGGKMWLDGCKGFGSTNSLNVADATSKAYVRGGQYQTENVIGTKVLY